MLTSGRTSHSASNSTIPSSWPPVTSTEGVATRSTSCSRTALPRYRGMASRSACSRAGPRPMRASSTRRGALPLRKPGRLTSRAMALNARSMSRSNSASSTSTYNLTLFPSRGSTDDFMRLTMLRGSNVRHRRLVGQNGPLMQIWKPHALATPHANQLDLRIGDRVRATVDLIGVPQGTEGKVILANGFNWLRYRVLFDYGAELADLDHRNLEPIGRAAKRVRKREKKAAAGR